MSGTPTTRSPLTLRQRIRTELRRAIINGELKPGTPLPSTRTLAAKWDSQTANVHAALTTLVKEGLLTRQPGVGTVVRQREPHLERVALYSMSNPSSGPGSDDFERLVISEITSEYGRRGVAVEILIDPRAERDQGSALPSLATACDAGRIQAVLAARIAPGNLAWLQKLPVLTASTSAHAVRNAVRMDFESFFSESLRSLREQGCRTVGFIHPCGESFPHYGPPAGGAETLSRAFAARAAGAGLRTSPRWIRTRQGCQGAGFEEFGHDAFRKLWTLKERPEGLVVYTDVVARGVLFGVMESGVDVPGSLRLALHRNTELPYYCPVESSFVEMRGRDIAHALISLVELQLRGGKAANVKVPFTLAGR